MLFWNPDSWIAYKTWNAFIQQNDTSHLLMLKVNIKHETIKLYYILILTFGRISSSVLVAVFFKILPLNLFLLGRCFTTLEHIHSNNLLVDFFYPRKREAAIRNVINFLRAFKNTLNLLIVCKRPEPAWSIVKRKWTRQ